MQKLTTGLSLQQQAPLDTPRLDACAPMLSHAGGGEARNNDAARPLGRSLESDQGSKCLGNTQQE